ncbi:MAG: hypothetical protein PHQ40_17070 [Anaerolineaceae bacterium]|nr:hypothetical protein [Anaerolineaceae bacterium]
MTEQIIQQVLEIEKKARAVYEEAQKTAEELPIKAEEEAQLIIDQAIAKAKEEARQIVAHAQSKDEIARIETQTREKIAQMETLAKSHMNQAVNYVLERVVGRE